MCPFMNMQTLLNRIGLVAAFMRTFEDFVRLVCFLVVLEMCLSRVGLSTGLTFKILRF